MILLAYTDSSIPPESFLEMVVVDTDLLMASEHRPAVRAPGIVRPAPVKRLRRVAMGTFGVAGYAGLELHLAEPHHAVRAERGAQMLRQRVWDER